MSSRPARGAARLAAILDALPDALLLVNGNGTVVNANAIAIETLEVQGAPLIGRGLLDIVPDFDPRRIPGSMRRPEEDPSVRTKPTRMVARRTDGAELQVEVTSAGLNSGRTPYASAIEAAFTDDHAGEELLVLVVRDLTGTLDTEAELVRQQRQTEMILRAASEGVVGVDTAGRIVLVNPAAAQILGHRASQLGGQLLHPLAHHSRADGTPLAFEETPLHDTLVSGRKHRVRGGQVLWTSDGRPVPVNMTTAPVRDGDQLVGAVLTFLDRRPYDALAARQAQLASVLRDGLRGPLDRLRGELSALAADPAGQLWPEANQVLHHLAAGYARMTTLVDNVLGYQRLDEGLEKLALKRVSLDTVVAAGVEGATELIGPGRAQFAVHAPPIEAEVDPERMAQALAHLIADVAGVDATGQAPAPAGGDSTIVVAAAQRGKVVRIEVRGPSPGGNPVHEPIVRGIVRQHGGVLQTHEVPGQNGAAAFVLEVPLAAGGSAPLVAPVGAKDASGDTTVMPVPVEPARGTEGAGTAAGRGAPADQPADGADGTNGGGMPGGSDVSGDGTHGAGLRTGGPIAVEPVPHTPTGRRRRRAPEQSTPPGTPVPTTEHPTPAGGTGNGRRRRALAAAEEPAPAGELAPASKPPRPTGRRRRALPTDAPDGAPQQPAQPIALGPAEPVAAPVPGDAPGPAAPAGPVGDAGVEQAGVPVEEPPAGPAGRPEPRLQPPHPMPAGPQGPAARPALPTRGAPVPPGGQHQPSGQPQPVGQPGGQPVAQPAAQPAGQPGGPPAGPGQPAEPVPFGPQPAAFGPQPESGGEAGYGPAGGPPPVGPVAGPPGSGEFELADPGQQQPVPPGPAAVAPAEREQPAEPAESADEPAPVEHSVVAASPILDGSMAPAPALPRPRSLPMPGSERPRPEQQAPGVSVQTLGQGVPVPPQVRAVRPAQDGPAQPAPTRRRKLAAPPADDDPRLNRPAAAGVPAPPAPQHETQGRGREYAISAPAAGTAEGPEPLDGPNGAVEVTEAPGEHAGDPRRQQGPADAELPPEPLDNPRRLLVWPEPDVSTQQALTDRGYRPVIVHSREEVDAQIAAYPAALFVDPLTGPITRTALQSLRAAAVAAEVPVLVTAGLGQASREAAYGADPAVLLKALAPRDSEQHPPRVLLVEERQVIADALAASLERRGMQAAHAPSDATAMELAAQLRPNLVVMDLHQVRRRRAGIIDWLRVNGLLNRTPFVVYTAADMDPSQLPQLASGETVLFLAERSTQPEVQSKIVDLLTKIGAH
ncbi:PAS domain-containing protein [Streptomyces sp. DSM 44915]|uniref:PAS domain-containing protein n=1 Tax=Streptomyces chisholmiae TaxID=3075540 RepID=A0ABU2JSJ9_9ACTN|nr:PAS domain-containing protein [Streptomyces sp. DSM 44915]MDT0267188.1 PAS domain-containing protein [Streptomyces sp. DSM 44915]